MKDLVKKLINRLEHFKDSVPTIGALLDNEDGEMTTEELLLNLNLLFDQEEKEIEIEHKKSYVTDDYENNVRFFAKQLVLVMVPEHEKLKEYESYHTLLRNKYVAYGFYSLLENQHSIQTGDRLLYEAILRDKFLVKILYLGLADFYAGFYGKFADNEEAIKLLCKYYPHIRYSQKDYNSIAFAISRHVTSAGTVGDNGFAYNGIKLISQYINNLSIVIIYKVLRNYELYRIVIDKVYRRQIFTIIEYSRLKTVEKRKYKFIFLDSLLLANLMNYRLIEESGRNNDNNTYNDFLNNRLSEKRLGVLKNSNTDEVNTYWTNDKKAERKYIVRGNAIIHIYFDRKKTSIYIKNLEKVSNVQSIPFNYENWLLDGYKSVGIEQKLNGVINAAETEEADNNTDTDNTDRANANLKEGNDEEVTGDNESLTFSMLYLDKYRTVSEQTVDFDHKFTYRKVGNELVPSNTSSIIPYFYSKKIYSLSCIVGRNGTGKSSTIDFLRSTFFKFIVLIRDHNLECTNGYISKDKYMEYNIIEQETEFLFVFNLGNQSYFLTNIENILSTGVEPFSREVIDTNNELSKVIYFSNMLSANQDSLLIDQEITNRSNLSEDEIESRKIADSLNNFRQMDYSEASSFIFRRRAMQVAIQAKVEKNVIKDIQQDDDNKNTDMLNKDLCYQLAFLKEMTYERLECLFDLPIDKKLELKSEVFIGQSEQLDLPIKDLSLFKPFLTTPDAKLEPFSSGQYAKFSFLAKLNWFLSAYDSYIEEFKALVGVNQFSNDDILINGETALIFIDEGELYYHPEWQRNYIKTLIDRIDTTFTQSNSKLQVVITTNSPFIISDILKEDITYLSPTKEEFDDTFGQNIHKLLTHNFFMNYTIGEFSRELILKVTKWLTEKDDSEISTKLSEYYGEMIEPKDYVVKISEIISKIGEPIYRRKLLDMLSKTEWGKQEAKALEIATIQKEMTELGRRLVELEQESSVKE